MTSAYFLSHAFSRGRLLAGAVLFATVAMPAHAQDAGAAATAPAMQESPDAGDTIVVTGSILRGADTGVSPQ